MVIRMLSVLAATMLFAFPVSTNGMSARPQIIFEKIEAGLFLQKDLRQDGKMLVHDKNGNVIGWAHESHLDSNKTIVYDMNNNVKGYMKQDSMDFRKLRFFNR